MSRRAVGSGGAPAHPALHAARRDGEALEARSLPGGVGAWSGLKQMEKSPGQVKRSCSFPSLDSGHPKALGVELVA